MSTVQPKNVYILGTAYCGSTLLGNALNAHSSVAFAGEVSRLPAFGVGEAWTVCPLCSAQEIDCPIWTPEFIEQVSEAGPSQALDLFREAAQVPVIVDGSKHVSWLRKVHGHAPVPSNTFVLIAVRSPFAFVNSTQRRDHWQVWFGANVWRDTIFDMLRCVGDLGLPHGIVRYEDFARDPEAGLKRICAWLGLDFEASMLRFWEAPVHGLGGNAGAYVWYDGFRKGGEYANDTDRKVAETYQERTFGGWSDDKWRQQLGPKEIKLILNTPGLADMCSLVGYDVRELLVGPGSPE